MRDIQDKKAVKSEVIKNGFSKEFSENGMLKREYFEDGTYKDTILKDKTGYKLVRYYDKEGKLHRDNYPAAWKFRQEKDEQGNLIVKEIDFYKHGELHRIYWPAHYEWSLKGDFSFRYVIFDFHLNKNYDFVGNNHESLYAKNNVDISLFSIPEIIRNFTTMKVKSWLEFIESK